MNPLPATPAERLTLSRERLRQALLERSGSAPPAAAFADDRAALPIVRFVLAATRGWWAAHPLHAAASAAAAIGATLVRPLARRHPLALVLGALALGGLFARSRPWRWLPRVLLVSGVLPQVVLRLLAQLPTPKSEAETSRRGTDPDLPAASQRIGPDGVRAPRSGRV